MKTLKLFLFSTLFLAFSNVSVAQSKKETFKVAGECGMCKNKIEGAAKGAGASFVSWNEETKELTVAYKNASANAAKVQQAIAAVGYDTPKFKATDEAYNKLHGCCKYERNNAAAKCCDSDKCNACSKDGKCDKDMACCKEAGCDKKDCCKKEDSAHANHAAGMTCSKEGATAACCKKS